MNRVLSLVVLIVLLLSTTSVIVANEHNHNQLAARVFALDYTNHTATYFASPDNHREGMLHFDQFDSAAVNHGGRFLLLTDTKSNMLQIYSSGLFRELHGDHYDIVAVKPQLYWKFAGGNQPRVLTSYQDSFILSDQQQRVGIVVPETGVFLTLPGGSGNSTLTGEYLFTLEPALGLVEIYNMSQLAKELTIRVTNPQGLTALDDYVWISTDDGLEIIELDHMHSQSLPVPWEQVPDKLYVQPNTFWVYAVSEETLMAISSQSGHIVSMDFPAGKAVVADNEDHYLTVVANNRKSLHLIDVAHGAPEYLREIALPQEILDLVWVGEDMWVAFQDQIMVIDNQGVVLDTLEVEGKIDQLMVALVDGDYQEEAYHDEHYHEDHSH